MGQVTTQARIKNKAAIDSTAGVEDLALFDSEGNPVEIGFPVLQVTSTTAIGTAAKTTTSSAPKPGQLVAIKLTNGNSAASPTVSFSGGAAKSVLLGGTAPASGEITVGANGVFLAFYDGTSLHQIGVYS